MAFWSRKEEGKKGEIILWDSTFRSIATWFISLIVIILILPTLFVSFEFGLDFTETGQIGDTLGGIMGPFIAIVASILTFLAFWVQYKANEQQKLTNEQQKIANEQQELDLKKERFESKFYEMLRLHRANVEEMNLGERFSGRNAFEGMYDELKFCYQVIEYICIKNRGGFDVFPEGNVMICLAYEVFFHGYSKNLKVTYEDYFEKANPVFLKELKRRIEGIKGLYSSKKLPDSSYSYRFSDTSVTNNDELLKSLKKIEVMDFHYPPFDGHANRLGHYYRHLYHTATFVVKQSFLGEEEKREYINILRAQMSSLEQLMLYYNAIAWFPKIWKDLFTKYSLIKNIPMSLVGFGEHPKKKYEKEIAEQAALGIDVFENNEHQNPISE